MKLQRFVASSDAKAILMVHETLGAEALIYATRSIDEGVEILAGLPFAEKHEMNETMNATEDKQPEKEDTSALQAVIQQLNQQLQSLEKNVQTLQGQNRMQEENSPAEDENCLQKNILEYRLDKLGFCGKFCQQFINDYLRSETLAADISDANISSALLKQIDVTNKEIIDERKIIALIGPTGAGKTTTIIKLAKRYIAKYGLGSIGFITTDYNDIAGKSTLLYYSRFFSAPLEYANDLKDLDSVLRSMANKKLILIDTNGVSQRDNQNLIALRQLIESQGEKISAYITLPCNIQGSILDEISRAFMTTNTKGFILTKQDECITLAPALGVSITYKKPIAYVCNGQNINSDIERANAERILASIMHDSLEMKRQAEIDFHMNFHRVANAFITLGGPVYA